MSTKPTLNEADQHLLRLLVATEGELSAELGPKDLEKFGPTVAHLRSLASEAQHERLVLRAGDLVALLSADPTFPRDMSGITTRDPAFLAPLAAAAQQSQPVSGAPLGVWIGAQRPAMATGAWAYAERELKDLVGLVASPVVPTAGVGPLRMSFRPLSKTSQLTEVVRSDLPAVVVVPVPFALRSAAEDAVRDLEPYSRTLESFDGLSFAVRAARLPAPLFALWMERPEGVRVRERIGELRGRASLEMQELLSVLLPGVEAPDRRHIGALSELLQRFGIGFEPDPRFLAPLAHPTTRLSLFEWRLDGEKPSTGFLTAASVLQIGFAMAGADGSVDSAEVDHVRQRAMALVSHDDERVRLRLRMDALAADPPDFDRLLLRLKGLRPAAKEVIAELLVGVATTDGEVSAAEYDALQRAYRAMRLGKPALDRTLDDLRGEVRLADAVGADRDRRSTVGQEQDEKRFDALQDLLLGSPAAAS
jgi:hypothetical protein